MSDFLFSKRFLKAANLHTLETPKTITDWRELKEYSELALEIEGDSDGGPTVNDNWIKIVIDGIHENAGSEADYIVMHFGDDHHLDLYGYNETEFPKGWWLSWDLNQASEYLETIPTDEWDNIFLENPTGDGILLRRITIVHSGVTILDWVCREWLDGSKEEKYGRLGLTAQILQHKLGQIDDTWIPQLHWAARELGKSDGRKYLNDESGWCSEFAAWCLRQALWDVPTAHGCGGAYFNSCTMKEYFDEMGRNIEKNEILNGDYRPIPGDYLRMQLDSKHSGLFVGYVDGDPVSGPDIVDENTALKTIEGNTSKTVAIRTRTIDDLLSVGSTR